MNILLLCILSVTPFYEANFTSLPKRSISVFSNPAGIGIHLGAEAFLTYHHDPKIITTGLSVGNLGIGLIKVEDSTYYEIATGLKLPGVFSIGYAFQFGAFANNDHIIGFICHPTQKSSFGYKTTLGGINHMFGGLSIMPFQDYITLSADIEYEGIDSVFTYYYGGMLQPLKGLKLHFHADEEFNWNTGLELSLGKAKIAGTYSSIDKKFTGGILVSAQDYETFLYKRTADSPNY